MRRFFESIGIVITILYILGATEVIDFQLCARPTGGCHKQCSTHSFGGNQ